MSDGRLPILMLSLPRSCWGCQALLPPLSAPPHICERCALSIEPLEPQIIKPGETVSLYAYQGVMRDLLTQLKLRGRRPCARPLGELLWHAPGNPLAPHDAQRYVLAMPLHWTRRFRRGFNQCDKILAWAEFAARGALGQQAAPLLRRIHRSPPQKGLDRRARQQNLQGVFLADSPENIDRDATIWVVDDVTTTGETLRRALEELQNAGFVNCRGLALMRADRGP